MLQQTLPSPRSAPRSSATGRVSPLLSSRSSTGRPSTPTTRAAAAATTMPTPLDIGGTPPGFSNANADQAYVVSIMGDLHLEPTQMPLFHAARDDLRAAMASSLVAASPSSDAAAAPTPTTTATTTSTPTLLLPGARVVQLGDLGDYKQRPGSRDCFATASEFLSGFGAPCALITGNHDLEGDEFETDADNLAAWHAAFKQRHYWAADLGHALAVGLSTVRFRSNRFSVHEVHIDDEQLEWFEATLAAAAATNRPVVVFTHAPPIGSGLKVVQNVHVANRCAWLNHSDRPERFLRLVEAYPNTARLWFSGHFHLSQNFPDSVSVVGRCAFVQTGVIGRCGRDDSRQSRLLRLDAAGFELLTVDHEDGGRLRLDLRGGWAADAPPPERVTPADELACDPSAGWLCSAINLSAELDETSGLPSSSSEPSLQEPSSSQQPPRARWFVAGPGVLLAQQDGLLVQYDAATRSPVGLVTKDAEDKTVTLVTADGGAPRAPDGSDVAAVLLTKSSDDEVERFERNEFGGFFTIYQRNKWVARKQAEAEAAAAEAAAKAQVAAP